MNFWKLILGFLAIALLPVTAWAAEFKTGETRVSVPRDQFVRDDLYIASGDVNIEGAVEGDVVAAGGTISISGNIRGDLTVAGGTIIITGNVGDDLRVAGGTVSVSGRVGDDLLVSGGTVEVTSEAAVGGEVRAGAGSLTLSGTIGSVTASVGTLTVTSGANIAGDLTYTSENEATIEEGATIAGQTIRREPARAPLARFKILGGAFPLFTLLMAFLFFYVFPNKSVAVAVDWRKRFWSNLLWGFLFFIGVPIASFILFVSLIGLPLGVGAMLLFVILLYLGHLASAIALGTWIKNWWEKAKEPRPTWLAVVLGVAALAILSVIPFVGWLLGFLIFLAGLGALIRYDWDIFSRLRANKTV